MSEGLSEIIFTGFGGQGIVLAGRIVGEAACLFDACHSTLTQSYGPEARGGACSAQVVIGDEPINFPYIESPKILVCMSQGGYEEYAARLAPGGTIIMDEDLVHPDKRTAEANSLSIPATRMAEEVGHRMMANIVMIGFLSATTGAISRAAAENAVLGAVPKGTEEKNLVAFKKGFEYGQAILKARAKKSEREGRRGEGEDAR